MIATCFRFRRIIVSRYSFRLRMSNSKRSQPPARSAPRSSNGHVAKKQKVSRGSRFSPKGTDRQTEEKLKFCKCCRLIQLRICGGCWSSFQSGIYDPLMCDYKRKRGSKRSKRRRICEAEIVSQSKGESCQFWPLCPECQKNCLGRTKSYQDCVNHGSVCKIRPQFRPSGDIFDQLRFFQAELTASGMISK